MASLEITLDGEKTYQAIQDAENLPKVLQSEVNRIKANANAYGSSFRTGIFHDHDTGETRGDTQPLYGGDVQRRGKSMVGLVWTGNYAAQKDNMLHNTLLKSI